MAAATAGSTTTSVTSATQTAHFDLPSGKDYIVSAKGSAAYQGDLQVSTDSGTTFRDVYDKTTKITFVDTGMQDVVVTGGALYRLDVDTFTSGTVTFSYREAGK